MNIFISGPTSVFVFGSNEAGIHGAGAAKFAYDSRGAEMGKGFGMSGSSFAIPTVKVPGEKLQYEEMARYVDKFIDFARKNKKLHFQVTQIGCGLAGWTAQEVAPLFTRAPENCFFDLVWKDYLPDKNFWGSHDS